MIAVVGNKEAIIRKDSNYFTNTEKTLTTKNLSSSLNLPGNRRSMNLQRRPRSAMETRDTGPTVEDLESTLSKLKSDLRHLNDSLEENYAKSLVFARDANYDQDKYIEEFHKENRLGSNGYGDYLNDDAELRDLLQRKDEEAVSHLPPRDSKWYRDPQHLTTSMGNFDTAKKLGISTRSVSPTSRGTGIFGAEMATKNIYGQLTSTDLASSMETFPVRLTAPHIVGVRSLLPPDFPVKMQRPATAAGTTSEVTVVPNFATRSPSRAHSPRPTWVPNSRNANASAKPPPALSTTKRRCKSASMKRATVLGAAGANSSNELVTRGRSITRHSTMSEGSYPRQIHPLPSETELRFLRSADQIDTRRALVENSPYQQELAKLRLARLRVEEEYLLQLKRESELERVRGPKPKWYTMKGPEFHYECNKNTTLHKNKKSWAKTLQYRNELLESSREFAQTV
ncbi:uncharacterized protein LOC120342753 [Styela clava]